MANTKISALTAATTPLAGTEVLPIVQSSTTKQVSVANLTAGRAISATSLSLTTTPLTVANGGTGLSSFTAGDIPYYASGTTLTGLGIGAANRVLTSSGSAPQWSTSLNLSGSITSGGTLQALATVQSSSGADLSLNANGANRDVIIKVNGTELGRFVGSTTGFTCSGIYNTTVGATNRDVYVDSTGVVGYVSSTRKSKINITPLIDTSWLYKLNVVNFNYRKKDDNNNYTDDVDGDMQYGMIAEEVEQIIPNLCFYDKTENGNELRGIQYSKLISVLVKEIQNLKNEIDQLKAVSK